MLHVISYLMKSSQDNFIDELRQGVDYGTDQGEGLPWEDFIEDNLEEPEEIDTEPEFPTEPPIEPEVSYESEEFPEVNTQGHQSGDVDSLNGEQLIIVDVYDDINALIRDSLLTHVIKFDYTTRRGKFTPDRIVEPHRTFVASTGNNILLTYDRTRGDIRGFIIGNIKPGGVLYENTFDVKPEIMHNRPNRRPVVKGRKPRRPVSKRR